MPATKEELERQVAASRVRVPKVIDTSVEESTEDEGAVDSESESVAKEKVQFMQLWGPCLSAIEKYVHSAIENVPCSLFTMAE